MAPHRGCEDTVMSSISYSHITIDEDGTVRVGQTRYKVAPSRN
jgi:hypothetical protein